MRKQVIDHRVAGGHVCITSMSSEVIWKHLALSKANSMLCLFHVMCREQVPYLEYFGSKSVGEKEVRVIRVLNAYQHYQSNQL